MLGSFRMCVNVMECHGMSGQVMSYHVTLVSNQVKETRG